MIAAPGRGRGDWMQTYTGLAFWPIDPQIEDIDVHDIAHALSMICRYGGHVHRFYSVAEHCVLMSEAIAPQHAAGALLHDSAEAYLIDLPRPIKRQIPQYAEIEDRLLTLIFERFGLPYPYSPEVKEADNRILLDEREVLLGPRPLQWSSDLESLPPLGVEIRSWTPAQAEAAYLARFTELFPEV